MSSAGIVLIFIGLVVLGFASGLLFNRSRAIIRFGLFIGLYFLFYYVLKQNINAILENGSLDINTTLNGFIDSFSQIIDQFNEAFVTIGNGQIQPINSPLNDKLFYQSLITTLLNFVCHFVAILSSFIISFILSFIINIPFYISYKKRNKVVRVDEDGKEVPVKIKKKFTYRIVPAVLGAVLSATICVMVFSPIYEVKETLCNVTESLKEIDSSVLNNAVVAIEEKEKTIQAEHPEYLETFNNQVGSLKEQIPVIQSTFDSAASQLVEKINLITDKLPSNSFTDLIYSFDFDCYKMSYGETNENIDIQLGSAFSYFTNKVNDSFKKLSEILIEQLSNFKI